MAKKGLMIGGYAVPGGRSGVAVAYACQLISQNPGIKQGDVHEQSARWAGLNFSTANWITSPGPKSPAEILWGRQKEGRGFRCYPNENTDKLGDPRPFLQAEILKEFDPVWKKYGSIEPGSLLRIQHHNGNQEVGVLVGFSLLRGIAFTGGLARSRQSLDDLSHFEHGNCGIMPLVMVGERQINWPIHMLIKE